MVVATSLSAQERSAARRVAPEPPLSFETTLAGSERIPGRYVDERTIPANTTVITAEEVRRSGATTIQEALARAEGVVLLDQQGFGVGSDSTLNLRGIVNSSRTNALVVLDGVKQNRLTGDEVHWQSIPLNAIERIEIIRGGGGTIYGEGALAGVINILTKQGASTPLETEEHVEIGSFGWQQYAVAARGRSHPLTYGLTYTRSLLDGYRDFSSSRNTNVTAHAGVALGPAARVSLNVLHSEDTTQSPGGRTLALVEQDRRGATIGNVVVFDDETTQVSNDWAVGPWDGFSAVLSWFWRSRTADSRRSNLFTITPSRGMSLRASHDWETTAARNVLIHGIELTDEKATTGTRGTSPVDESNRAGIGLYVEDTLTLRERLSLIGGLRYDKFRYEEAISFPSFTGTLRFTGFSPKAGLTYDLLPERLNVFASYARPFKAPNVDDFSGLVPDFAGNVDLRPQQANAVELGARFTDGPARAEATWFYARIDDEILFNRLNGAFGRNDNFDTRRFGLELAGRLDVPARGLRSSVTYAFTDAEFVRGQFAGNTIPATPAHLLNASVGVSCLPNLWVDLDWRLVNDFYRINDFRNVLGKGDNFGVLNLRIQYETPTVQAFLKITNLTNEEYVEFQSSNASNLTGAGENPMPPIAFTAGVTVKF
jgi:iron complex outermembrane receptor protein